MAEAGYNIHSGGYVGYLEFLIQGVRIKTAKMMTKIFNRVQDFLGKCEQIPQK